MLFIIIPKGVLSPYSMNSVFKSAKEITDSIIIIIPKYVAFAVGIVPFFFMNKAKPIPIKNSKDLPKNV